MWQGHMDADVDEDVDAYVDVANEANSTLQ